jgi:Kef-type K+ transport system membrane component KefB
MLWGGAVSKLGPMAGPEGELFQIGVLAVTACLIGWLVSFIGLPSLLGMMLAGIALRNAGFVVLTGGYLEVAAALRYQCQPIQSKG